MAVSTTYRALDGGLVHLETQSDLGPASSQVVAQSHLRGISALSFASGGPGFAEGLALSPQLGRDVALVHELELQRGALRIWSGLQTIAEDGVEYFDPGQDGTPHPAPVHFAGWSAGGYEVLVTRYSGPADEMLRILEDFSLTATPEGVVCTPVDPSVFWFVQPASVIVDVPDTGVVEVFELAGNKARSLPTHSGTPVVGGELFVGGQEASHRYFVHVSDSAVSYLAPGDPEESQAALDFLGGLRVTWTR